jgi:serine/threonine protein phosphatase PrpC
MEKSMASFGTSQDNNIPDEPSNPQQPSDTSEGSTQPDDETPQAAQARLAEEQARQRALARASTRPLTPLPEDEDEDDELDDTAEGDEPEKSEGKDNAESDETADVGVATEEEDDEAEADTPPGEPARVPLRAHSRFQTRDLSRAATQPFREMNNIPPEEPEPPAEDEPEAAETQEAPVPDEDTDLPDVAEPDESDADAEDAELDDDTMILDSSRVKTLQARTSQQGLSSAALRDVGRVRQVNQDSVLSMMITLPRQEMDMPMGLFVVADGMGGHHGGEVASRLAIRTIVHEVISQLVMPAMEDGSIEALQPMMISAVQEANHVIWDHAQTVGSDMGTTCTAVLLLGQALYIAHVGDSRAYLRDAGGLRVLTHDHSTVGRLIEMGQLEPSAARDHPLRNQLYRTIGQQQEVQVDFVYQTLGNSTHLLICSDGLWGMVADEELEEVLTTHLWPQDACNELIKRANLAGGEDNISAVVVTLPLVEGTRL